MWEGVFEVEVLVDGEPLSTENIQGIDYVVAITGKAYIVRVIIHKDALV
jgi:hypothetical protein